MIVVGFKPGAVQESIPVSLQPPSRNHSRTGLTDRCQTITFRFSRNLKTPHSSSLYQPQHFAHKRFAPAFLSLVPTTTRKPQPTFVSIHNQYSTFSFGLTNFETSVRIILRNQHHHLTISVKVSPVLPLASAVAFSETNTFLGIAWLLPGDQLHLNSSAYFTHPFNLNSLAPHRPVDHCFTQSTYSTRLQPSTQPPPISCPHISSDIIASAALLPNTTFAITSV
jgi:hypothetical protein